MRKSIALCLGLLLALCLLFTDCSRKEQPANVNIPQDCKIGALIGTTFQKSIHSVYPQAQILYYENLSLMCLALKKGQIDAFVCMSNGSNDLLSKNPGIRHYQTPVALHDTSAMVFRQTDLVLEIQFNTFLDSIKANGTLERIRNNWFAADAPRKEYHPTVTQGEPINVGVETGQSFSTLLIDDEVTGFEPELLLRFGDYINRPVHLVEMRSVGMIPALLSGRLDMIANNVTPTLARSKNLLFSQPYDIYPVCFCVYDPSIISEQKAPFGETVKQNIFEEKRYMLILEGLLNTLIITFLSIVFGYLGGLLLVIAKQRGRITKRFAEFYCEFIESIPIVVLLLFMFYVVFATSHMSAMTVAVITFSLYFTVGAADAIERSADSVDKGQLEAGVAMGFKQLQVLAYILVPQAADEFFSQFRNKAVGLIENTSIVGFIAIKDMTMVTDLIRSQTYNSLIPLAIVAALYFGIAFGITKSFEIMAGKFSYKKRNRI